MAFNKIAGGTEGVNWVSQALNLDKAAETLSDLSQTISDVFSSIHQNYIALLIELFQQCCKSLDETRSIDSTGAGTRIHSETVQKGMSGTSTQRVVVKSPTTCQYEVSQLMDKLRWAQADYDNKFAQVNSYEDYDYYDINGLSGKVSVCREKLESKEREFKAQYPIEYQAFKSKLAEEAEGKSKKVDPFVEVSLTGSNKGSSTIVHSRLEDDSSSDEDWWGTGKDELDELFQSAKQQLGFSSKPVFDLENSVTQQVSSSGTEDWW